MESLQEAFRQIRALTDKLNSLERGNVDAKNRRIVNMRPSVDQTDGVIRAELYQLLKKATPDINEITRVGDLSNPFFGRALCSGLQTTGTDKLDPRYTVRLPAGKRFIPQHSYISCKVKPTVSDFVFDWTLSNDGDAATFNSIYNAADADKLVIEVGERFGIQSTFAISEFLHGDIMTVDILNADGIISGIEAVILWEMVNI